ncbi:DUF2809 domain-containing protein [Robertkochia solimangrovi]|uniref:ribosomal maturation YjgA family protein n=1 Tax=Robertkochia solimangrovi TaxID=2213046 RepID=UPI0011810E87|nr:DUF2809 domain-containing protein [Robertkochia solimangrovi]TRZ43578.1 DUF2809 domain-containing protein [Robertkochia solimangrovi]
MRFNAHHFLKFSLLLLTEVLIAIYIHHGFIRGFAGDVLVILMLYYGIKCILPRPSSEQILKFVLLFACIVELLQLFEITRYLHMENRLLRTLLGTTFDPLDIIAYVTGYLLTLFFIKYSSLAEPKDIYLE